MKTLSKKLDEAEKQISSFDFMESYNKNIPAGFPHATEALLKKFKEENPVFFTHGDLWSLDEHRKKMVDWFQRLNH
ncbi:hypothetical protein H7X87_02540 [Acetobacteraceae bacterium]|nr:hypothetical protein [Candidatus Parcubacteria bacterium]